MEQFISLINNLGFPITCVVVMGIYIKTLHDEASKRFDSVLDLLEKLLEALEEEKHERN